VGKHAGLAHLRDFGQGADAQAFQPDLRGQAQSGINDGQLGLLAFCRARPDGALPSAAAPAAFDRVLRISLAESEAMDMDAMHYK